MMKMNLSRSLALALSSSTLTTVEGCSRVFQNKYDPKVSGRSMDWGFSFEDYLHINPRGQELDGGVGDSSVTWTSQYGSVTSSAAGFFMGENPKGASYGYVPPGAACTPTSFGDDLTTDGVNEAGLGAHLLYLGHEDGTEWVTEPSDEPIDISVARWIRYVLDNFATVDEAVTAMSGLKTRQEAVCRVDGDTEDELNGFVFGLHMAIEDATGDSAVVEHVGGVWQFYHNKDGLNTEVMTNDPTFDKHKEFLSQYEHWGGDKPLDDKHLPGGTNSPARFLRLEYLLHYTPEPKNSIEAIANVRSMINNSNVPFGAPYKDGVYPTWWTSFIDTQDKVYYFDWLYTPNMIWIRLEDIDWETLEAPLYLDPKHDIDLAGHVLCDFMTHDDEDPGLPVCNEEGDDEEGDDEEEGDEEEAGGPYLRQT
mmetsp:Transcript_21971/g.48886  ORF Transcript_21971/g.48886 Transcript_21971/m.48886 type:complete len:422 (+) Transcript_21971:41-1306(+)